MDVSSSAETKLATAKMVLATAASVAASAMLARSIAQDFLPHEFQAYFFYKIRNFFGRSSSQLTMVIDEYDGYVSNEIYEAAEIYLGSKTSPSTQRIKVSKPEKENITVKVDRNEEIVDIFQDVKFKWVLVCSYVDSKNYNSFDHGPTSRSEVRSFEVSFPKEHKETALETYLPYIVKEAKSMVQETKQLKIFTFDPDQLYGNLADAWIPVKLDHPATFDTLALDTEVKDTILKDLERFVKRKDYYRKVGKAWKRGYLLYGPPGTGKSSLIAAMANYLNFNIYDLELTEVRCNSNLRKLLLATANRSILVVEDIDCTIELQNRMADEIDAQPLGQPPQKQVTLSGLLNFIDGLWSSCGDERIIVFTTNHKEKLDPALLRPGRMDVHLHMSYCTPCGFKLLADNYLGIKDDVLFGEIEELIKTTEVTPAEVAEQLMRGDEVDETVLNKLIEFLQEKRMENEEKAKAEKNEKESEIHKELENVERIGPVKDDIEVGEEKEKQRLASLTL